MAEVTIHSPSETIVKAAQQPSETKDANGRAITVRRIGPLDRLKMFEVIGPENSRNEPYLGYAALAFSVAKIDGEEIPRPSNKLQLEALIQRLGDEGMEAAGTAVQGLFTPDDDKERIKN